MIKFFKKIRQNLMIENKFSKYLLYAIGEIVLVVIGILIALQINNWNENRKNRIIETNILKSIKLDLITDTLRYNISINNLNFSARSIKTILSKPANQDSIATINFISSFTLSGINSRTTSFEFLKTTGLDIIHYKELRDSIIVYYEQNVKSSINRFDNNSKRFNIESLEPYLAEHFRFITQDSSLTEINYVPLNYKELINDDEYSSLLIQRFIYNSQTLDALNVLTSKAKYIISEIDKKIDK